jgi:hypothetical protein
MGYYLEDMIYPKYATFVKTIAKPVTKMEAHFPKMQEVVLKDIDKAFGALHARFAIVGEPRKFWDKKTLHNIITAYVIMHNMITKDERDMDPPFELHNVGSHVKPSRNSN